MPILYLVATPIGNLEDISLRALRILGEVSLVAAEDTRVTGKLLSRYNITTRMISYHDFSDRERISALVDRLNSEDIALVSDAGTPGLSDPGYRLVQAAIEAGHQIIPVPGPAAAIAALVSSGLPTDRFLFLGFLPRQQRARRRALQSVATLPYTIILYEAPHRLADLLADISQVLGDRQLAVSRELTKMHEEIWRGSAKAAVETFQYGQIRGEVTVSIAGADPDVEKWTKARLVSELDILLARGESSNAAAASLAANSGWKKRDIYRLALQRKDSGKQQP